MVNGLSPELGSDEYESEKEATEALLSAHLKIVSILKEKKECISTYSKDTVLANEMIPSIPKEKSKTGFNRIWSSVKSISNGAFYAFENLTASSVDVIAQAEKKIIQLLVQIDEKERKIEEFILSQQQLEEQLKKLEAICNSNSADGANRNISEELSTLNEKYQKAIDEIELSHKRYQSQSQDLAILRESYQTVSNDFALLRDRNNELKAEKGKDDFVALSAKHKDAVGDLSDARRELERLQSSYDSLHQALGSALSNSNTLSNELKNAEMKLLEEERRRILIEKETTQQMQELGRRISALEAENKALISENIDLFDRINQRETVLFDVRSELSAANDKIAGLLDLLEVAQHQTRPQIQTSNIATQSDPRWLAADIVTPNHSRPSFPRSDLSSHSQHSHHSNSQGVNGSRSLVKSHSLSPSDSFSANRSLARIDSSGSLTSQNRRTSLLPTDTSEHIYVAPKIRDPDQEALETGLLLSKQQAEYGVNMFDALQPEDEGTLQEYMQQGFTWEEAVFLIFRDRHVLPAKHREASVDTIMAMPHVKREGERRRRPSFGSIRSSSSKAEQEFSAQSKGRIIERKLSKVSNCSDDPEDVTRTSRSIASTKHRDLLYRSRSGEDGADMHLPLTEKALRAAQMLHSSGAPQRYSTYSHEITPTNTKSSVTDRQTPLSGERSADRSAERSGYSRPSSRVYNSPTEALQAMELRRQEEATNGTAAHSRNGHNRTPDHRANRDGANGTRGTVLSEDDLFGVAKLMKKSGLDRSQAIELYLSNQRLK